MRKRILTFIVCLTVALTCSACKGDSGQKSADTVHEAVAIEDLQGVRQDADNGSDAGKTDDGAIGDSADASNGSSGTTDQGQSSLGETDQQAAESSQGGSGNAQGSGSGDGGSHASVDSGNSSGSSDENASVWVDADNTASQQDPAADGNANAAADNNAAAQNTTAADKPAAEQGTPVANHGKLSVKGTNLVDKNGKNYQIKGVSTHGIAWFPEYVNKEAFRTMRDEWGINCVRLAMYSGENSGYCTGGNQAQLKGLVNNGVEYATDLGLYVIIDWHVLGDQDPNVYKSTAKEFFKEMSAKYASYDNVLYEICNEPNGGTSWSSVKSYAEEVIPIIKANDPNAVIIVGTPTWSQDVDQAAANPIKGYTNIMYTIHFYADTHKDWLRQRMLSALNSGIPLFCSEFGICDASGAGNNNKSEGEKWIATMDANNISYCIWNLSNKAETSSLISSGCSKKSGWTMNDLSDSGKWYVGILNNGVAPGSTPAVYDGNNSSGNNDWNNNDNNNNNGNNNGGGSSSVAVSSTKDNTQAQIVCSGNWESGSVKNYQYTINIKNTGSSTISNWSVTVDFGTNVQLDSSWSGNFNASGSRMTVTPVDYNKEIGAGQSTEVGCIISASGSVGEPKITIN